MDVDAAKPEPLPSFVEVLSEENPVPETSINNGNRMAKDDVAMEPTTNSADQPDRLPEKMLPLRFQKLPLPKDIRDRKANTKDVIVIAFGSFGVRYGFAVDSTPKRVFPAVAFPRRPKIVADPSSASICIPMHSVRSQDQVDQATKNFQDIRDDIAQELILNERRRGGGRPIPWKAVVEEVPADILKGPQYIGPTEALKASGETAPNKVLVGHDVEILVKDPQRARLYDVVFPIWDGKIMFDCGAPESLVRKSLDCLIDYIVEQLKAERDNKARKVKDQATEVKAEGAPVKLVEEMLPFAQGTEAQTFVALVVPETSQRRDTAEIVDAVFRSRSLQTAAIFIHQSAVSCAFGAGLATCAVVDIGHSATTIACVEDGLIWGESRIHLNYGSYHIQNTLGLFLKVHSNLEEVLASPGADGKQLTSQQIAQDREAAIAKIVEQTGTFNVDANDTLGVALFRLPSGRALRLRLGVAFRAVPCYGLIHPALLSAASEAAGKKKQIPKRGVFEMNADDDNFATDIFNDIRRSGIATAALPIGTFANDPGQAASETVDADKASIVDAIIWSVAKAVELKRPDQQSRTAEHYRRYLNAIVLAGGGASIDGIALALEARIKKGFLDAGLNVADVTVIDGGKGKGDEELAAAAATLKEAGADGGIIDDTDTASLPWKGGAVMVEADAVRDYWIYRDDWDDRNVRALRERSPFYW